MYRSVFIDGKIINPVTGKVAILRMPGGKAIYPGRENGDGDTIIPYLDNIEIGLKRGASTDLKINLSPTYDQALELMSKDSPWIRIGNTLALRWGYADVPGAISDWYYGYMTMPEPSFGEEITLSVSAKTLMWNAERVERVRNWCKDGPKSFRFLAGEIAKRYGCDAFFANKRPGSTTEIDREVENFFQGGMTDLQFLVLEAEKLGLRFTIQNGKIYFVDANDPVKDWAYSAIFKMYQKFDVKKNEFPLLSFSPESMGTMFIQNFQGFSVMAFGPNSDPKKEPEKVNSTDAESKSCSSENTVGPQTAEVKAAGLKDADKKPLNAKASVAVSEDDGEAGRHFCLPTDGTESKDMLKNQVDSLREICASDQGLIVNFSSIAIPNLFPSQIVNIEGVGDYFSTSYMLNEVNIRVDQSGASMDLVAFGRGFPSVNPDVDSYATKMKYQKPEQDPNGVGSETRESQ